ncbi:TIGR03545 family protein [Aliikangiella maris]|uniref:TIGR03545 family protein n=2 Tax=Aliikangiella maris TaxID=3162458 RepID=A0ABV3MN71_9GAMM
MKLIRWWGIAVFFVLILLIVAAWYLLAPFLIKGSIEEMGSEALGAKVELESVDLSLFPLGVSLNHLVAADPNAPMSNLFDAQKITFAVDSSMLLWKKVIIDELTIDGVKSGTQRQTSGELPGGRKSAQAVNQMVELAIPDIGQVDVKSMVEKADLITIKRINQLKSSQGQMQQQWQTALDKKAFEKRVNDIKAEYDRLAERAKKNKLNLLKDRDDWKKLKKQIDEERQQIASLSDQLKADKKQLAEQLKLVKNGPGDDLDAIMQKLGLGNGLDGLVDKYLGPQYTPWVKRIIQMVKEVKPVEDKTTQAEEEAYVQVGKKVYFKDEQIFPEILVKKVLISGSDQQWQLNGNGMNLGYLPWLTGNPAKLNLKFNGAKDAKIDLQSDWKNPQTMQSTVDISVNRWPVESMSIMQTEKGPWMLTSGDFKMSLKGELTLQTIDLNASFSIASPKLQHPESLPDWQLALAQSISGQSQLDFNLSATGALESPKIRLKSNMEKLFQNVMGAQLKQKAEKLKDKAKTIISEKVGDISGLENFNSNFEKWQAEINNKDELLKDILGKIKI